MRLVFTTTVLFALCLAPLGCGGGGAAGTDGAAGADGGMGGTAGGGAGAGGSAGAGGAGGANMDPIGIPDGKFVATLKVSAGTDMIPTGDYDDLKTPGFAGQRNDDEFFANFDGKIPMKTDQIALRFGGFNRVGSFPCGTKAKPADDYAIPTSLEFWGPGGMYKGSNPMGSCTVTVTKLDAMTVLEGRYTGTLYAADKFVTVSGEFRANRK